MWNWPVKPAVCKKMSQVTILPYYCHSISHSVYHHRYHHLSILWMRCQSSKTLKTILCHLATGQCCHSVTVSFLSPTKLVHTSNTAKRETTYFVPPILLSDLVAIFMECPSQLGLYLEIKFPSFL